ncbi:signal peptidase I [Candidatus Roizmanbacteria bacterium]|nr:signal peptidase I [Candidatus Roizmanbacteria bacterium]
MKTLKFIFNLISYLLLGAFGLVIIFTVASNQGVLGGYRSFVVQSGSMEPTIMTGDIVLIQSQSQYMKNDVVTFKNEEGRIVTHRILKADLSKTPQVFTTKGDANAVEDANTITQDSILGKVQFVAPKLGYFVSYARSPMGVVIFIVVPALILILSEVISLFKHARS